MRNLLDETNEILAEHNKTFADVVWIGSEAGYIEIDEFIRLADTIYSPGYGAAQVATDLVIIGNDFYMERGEYDGSEWWDYNSLSLFNKPDNKLIVQSLIGDLWPTLRELQEEEEKQWNLNSF